MSLLKRAEKAKEGKGKQVAAGGAAAALAINAPKNLLGYERVYHGTPNSKAVDSIKKTGLKKSLSGTGVSATDVARGVVDKNDVKGRVFTTKSKEYAKHYTGAFAKSSKRVVGMRVPYRTKDRLHTDAILEGTSSGKTKEYLGKKLSATDRLVDKATLRNIRVYKHSIKKNFMDHGKGGLGNIKQFASKGNMRRYLSTGSGKARFAKGVAQVVGAGALARYAMKGKKDEG